jgi:hypothetical protein
MLVVRVGHAEDGDGVKFGVTRSSSSICIRGVALRARYRVVDEKGAMFFLSPSSSSESDIPLLAGECFFGILELAGCASFSFRQLLSVDEVDECEPRRERYERERESGEPREMMDGLRVSVWP